MKYVPAHPDGVSTYEEFGLLELLIFFARYKLFILPSTLFSIALALLFSLSRPDQFSATARLLPAQETQFSSVTLASELGGFGSSSNILAGGKTATDLYAGILKSDRVLDALVAAFNLKEVYDTASQEAARRQLKSRTTIVAAKDGFLTITVKDGDRERVARLVNAYVSELNRLSRRVAVGVAKQQRLFYRRELSVAGSTVATAEKALREHMNVHGMGSATDNAMAIAAISAKLMARIAEQRVKLETASAFMTDQNPEYARARQQLKSLQTELDKLANGLSYPSASRTADVASMPLVRALDDARELYSLLLAQNELTGLDIAEDVTTTQVLDAAVIPESILDPERMMVLWQAGMAGWILATAGCFVAEARRRLRLVAGTL